MQNKGLKISVYALLGALAICLSIFESLIPPLPILPAGAKAGFSNIITMFAVGSVGLPCAIFIVILKAGFALLTRGFTAFLMSFFAGIISMLVMYVLYKKTSASIIGIGIISALSHNITQLIIAYFITSVGVLFYIPSMLIFGVFSGIAIGLVVKILNPLLNNVYKQIVNAKTEYT